MSDEIQEEVVEEQIADNKRDQGVIVAVIIGLFSLRIFGLLKGNYFVEGISWSLLFLTIGTVGKQVVNKDTISNIIKNFRK